MQLKGFSASVLSNCPVWSTSNFNGFTLNEMTLVLETLIGAVLEYVVFVATRAPPLTQVLPEDDVTTVILPFEKPIGAIVLTDSPVASCVIPKVSFVKI
jgi:hypothetical protein